MNVFDWLFTVSISITMVMYSVIVGIIAYKKDVRDVFLQGWKDGLLGQALFQASSPKFGALVHVGGAIVAVLLAVLSENAVVWLTICLLAYALTTWVSTMVVGNALLEATAKNDQRERDREVAEEQGELTEA